MSTKILGIDVGSFQVCAIIAQHDESGIKIIGIGTEKTQGIRKGVITNIEQAAKSIKNALIEAQRVAGTHYERVIVSISGAYTKSVDSSGVVNIPNHEIGIKEIERAMQMADHTADIPHEYEKLHILPYNFKVDGQEHIEDPIGMNGTRLEVQTHIVTVQKSSISNLRKAINLAGVQLDNIARTVIANNTSDAHIAIHYDGDDASSDKGVFYMKVPNVDSYKKMEPVSRMWQQHDRLGESLVSGLKEKGLKVFGRGTLEMDLTQTSYSTIPSIDIELGNNTTATTDEANDIRAEGLAAGVDKFFNK